MERSEEFDTSDLAWLAYKFFYGQDFEIETVRRKHVKFKNPEVDISGDTDFNFGPGWSHSIAHKYEKYLEHASNGYKSLYKNQLSICKDLYKSILNVSLMPQTGNLQGAKKGIGNDRFDTYIWALNSFYKGETSLLFNYASFDNTESLKQYFDLFRKNTPIYNYCNIIYGIDRNLVDDLILSGKNAIDSPERVVAYMQLAYRFWNQKFGKLEAAIKNSCLSNGEREKMASRLMDVEAKLKKWYD